MNTKETIIKNMMADPNVIVNDNFIKDDKFIKNNKTSKMREQTGKEVSMDR